MSHGHVRKENLERTQYRSACPRHVAVFELDGSEDDKRAVFRLADRLRMAGNQVVYPLRNNIRQIKRTKEYRKLQKDYGWHSEHMKNLDESSSEYEKLLAERNAIAKEMSRVQERCGITFTDIRKAMEDASKDYGIHSVFGLTRAEDIWKGAEKVLYADGKSIHTKKRGNLPVIRAKQIERAIILKTLTDEKGEPYLSVSISDGGAFIIHKDNKDWFLMDEYQALLDFLLHPEQEEEAVKVMTETGEVRPVFRPACCSVVCETIRGKLRLFLHVTIASDPVRKLDRFGNERHVKGDGRVGVDIGTRSVASVSEKEVRLENLGERSPGILEKTEKRKAYLLRRMDRSRRTMNPERFNPDGTYRKGSRGKWVNSRAYGKYLNEYRELCRKERVSRKYANLELAHDMRSCGDVLVTEPKNARQLAKRSKKETERQEKPFVIEKKDGTKTEVYKCKKKKRFGKSIGRSAPASFQDALERLFGAGYHTVPGCTYRASQYDLFLDEYIKKKLSERWLYLPDGRAVQRDIMSGFLLFCADDDFATIDRDRCLKAFDCFWEMHQKCIERIVKRHLHICNSGIKAMRSSP